MANTFTVEAIFRARDLFTATVRSMFNGFGSAVRAMRRNLRGFNSVLDSTVSKLVSIGKTALKITTVGFASMAAAAALFIREFSKVEDAEAAFTPLLGSVKKAKELVAALNDTAASTPFQFQSLADQANQLLPVMNGNIEDVIKTIRMLGDTAGGNAQKLQSVTRGFTKAMLKGKVDLESLNIIGEAGVPIFNELAKSMGLEVNAAFFKMITAGKVTTKELTKAFQTMTSEGGIFFNGMAIASRTVSGKFSTLKDNISTTAAEIGSILAPTVKDLIDSMTGVAQRVTEWVKANRELIKSNFLKFVESSKEILKTIVTWLRDLNKEKPILDRVGDFFAQIAVGIRFIKENGPAILKFGKWILIAVVALKAFSVVLTAINLLMLANPFGLAAIAIVAIAGAVALLATNSDAALKWFEDLGPLARGILKPIELLIISLKWISDNSGKILGVASRALTFGASGTIFGGGDDESGESKGGQLLASPQERAAKMITESTTTNKAELTIKDEKGLASITGGTLGSGLSVLFSGAM